MGQRNHVAASRALRDVTVRAHVDDELAPFDLRVLSCVGSFTAGYSKLEDSLKVNELTACVYGLPVEDLKRWHRTRVTEALRKLAARSLITYSARRGRPSADEGGPVVVVGLVAQEMHPLSKVLFHEKAPRGAGALDEKSTLSPREKHLVAPPENSTPVESSVNTVPVYECPKCRARVWDNREAIRRGERPDGSPTFKCRSKACDWASWKPHWDEAIGSTASRNGHKPSPIDVCELCDHNGLIYDADSNSMTRCTHAVAVASASPSLTASKVSE